MTQRQIRALRKRTWHYLSYEVAISAGMTGLAELEQFLAGTFHPSPDQLTRLANCIGIPNE
jgi:hypothetical protein